MSRDFLDTLSQVDGIISAGPETPNTVRSLISLFDNPEVARYFYQRVVDPEWIAPLRLAGQFTTDCLERYALDRTGKRTSEITALKYLVRAAGVNAFEVAEVVSALEVRDNPSICTEIFRAANRMPIETLRPLTATLVSWLSGLSRFNGYDELGELVKRLWRSEGYDDALKLLEAAMKPISKNGIIQNTRQVQCRMDDWALKELLKVVLPILKDWPGISALESVSSVLCSVRHAQLSECPAGVGLLAAKLPSIGNNEQNQLYEDYPNLIVYTVRDIAITLAPSHWDDVITVLRRCEDIMFIRIELYLRSKFPQRDPEGTSELLRREEVLRNSEFHHERFHLLKACFGVLSEAAKANYLRFIDDEARWAKIRENRSDIEDEEWPGFKRRLIYGRLIPIAEYLEGEWKSRYAEYRAEFGEEPHPDFEVYMEGGQLINHLPSRPLEEYADHSAKDFATQIRALEVAPDASPNSKSELANTLRDLVAARTAEFAAGADHFAGLPIMYTSSFLRSIRDYLETRRPLEPAAWNSVLLLCKLEVQQYQNEVQSRDDYRDIYIHLRIILSILQSGLKGRGPEIPIDERDLTWEVLYPLTDHPDPPASEEDPDADMAVSSINTVRGEAMHSVVDYALWIMRSLGEDFKGMATVPNVQEVLVRHLTEDKALTICAVYGKWYPWLETIDQNWAKEWKSRIFPESDERRRRVAWETYVTFCPPYNGILETLKNDYSWAVTQIGRWPERQRSMGHPDACLLEHLFAYFWRGKLSLEDDEISIGEAYANVLEEHKVEVLRYVGHGVKEWISVDVETLDRLKSLWVEVVKSNSGEKALENFGLWFSSGKFDAPWSLAELQHVLDRARPPRPEHWVIERLGQLAKEFPSETLGCLQSMYEHAESPLYLEHWWEHVMEILRAAISSENQVSRTKAFQLANIIGAKGLQPQNLSELRALVSTV